MGGGGAVVIITMGWKGPAAVNAGNIEAAEGTVALPGGMKTGWGIPATLGGLGAAGTTSVGNGRFSPYPTSGGGSHVPAVPSGKLGGRLCPPRTICGCGMPAVEGGTGAETIGGVPLDTVRLCNVGPAAAGDDDVLPVRENEPAGAGWDQGRAGRVDERPAEEIGRSVTRRRANPPFRPEPLNLVVELRPAWRAGDGRTGWRGRARKSPGSPGAS